MKMKNKNKKSVRSIALKGGLVIVAAVVALSSVSSHVFAEDYDSQIAQLQNEVNSYSNEVARLRGEADTLQRALSVITADKNRIQAQVDLSQAKYDKLVQEIEENQKKLEKQKRVYGERVADLSADTKTSPIELLAGSQSIGDYIRGDAYQSSIQDQIKSAIKEVKTLKATLAKQKKEVEAVLKDQQSQRDALAAKEAEQAKLLADTRGQEETYKQVIGQKNGEIAQKRAAQAAAMAGARGDDGLAYGTSSYPWSDKSMNYNDNCVYPNGSVGADIWGYCYRQCVSYVAWKLANDGRGNGGFSGQGHAIGWWYGGSGVGLDSVQGGDVLVWDIGGYGHVAYVEWANATHVRISQMNVPYDSGSYSEKTYSKADLAAGIFAPDTYSGNTFRRFH